MTRARRLLGASLAALVVAAGLSAAVAAPAAAATSVATEAELRAALADPATTEVVLADSIDLTDCTPSGGDLDRAGALTLDGAGFTLRQTCAGERVLESTFGTLTLTRITITGGDQTATIDPTSVLGGGVRAANDLVLDDTTVTGNTVSGSGSSFGTGAWGSGAFGGGVEADGAITLTTSHVDHNTARNAGSYGAGILSGAGQDVTIMDSSVDGNIGEAADPTTAFAASDGGGVAIVTSHGDATNILTPGGTVHATRTSISRNVEQPDGAGLTFAVGGGVFSENVELVAAHVDANEQRPVSTGTQSGTDIAVGWGAGVFAKNLIATGATLDRNLAVPAGPQAAAEAAGAWSAYPGGSLDLTDSTVRDNAGQAGATGVSNCVGVLAPVLTLTRAVVSGNQGSGLSAVGGGACSNTATIDWSTIAGNSVTGTSGDSFGGGAVVGAGTVSSSTIWGNSVSDTNAHGGGIVHDQYGGGAAGDLALVDSTVAGNIATGTGTSSAGGIEQLQEPTLGNAGPLSLVFSTVAGNSAASGANFGSAGDTDVVTSFASVISYPLGGGANCAPELPLTDEGYTQITDTSCGTTAAADPQLAALADNGGPTETMLPADTSPLVARVPIGVCTGTVTADQRGITRPQGSACTVGAVEVADPVTPVNPPVTPPETPTATAPTAAVPVVARPNFTG